MRFFVNTMTEALYLSPFVFIESVASTIDLATAATLAQLSKDWNAAVAPAMERICWREYERRLPALASMLHQNASSCVTKGSAWGTGSHDTYGKSFRRVEIGTCSRYAPVLAFFNHGRIIRTLEEIHRLFHTRRPREPYRNALKCFMDGSLLCDSTRWGSVLFQANQHCQRSADRGSGMTPGVRAPLQPTSIVQDTSRNNAHVPLRHLVVLFAYVFKMYPQDKMPITNRINFRIWLMFFVLDFIRCMLTDPYTRAIITRDRTLCQVTIDKVAMLHKEVKRRLRQRADAHARRATAVLKDELLSIITAADL